MRILVLGATGFVGRNCADYFAAKGHEVVRHGYRRQADLQADLRLPFDFSGYDVVIQAAATTSGSKDIVNTPAIHVTDNVIMNALIFRAAAEAKVKHVIFFSCTTMFSQGCITEETPIDIHPKYFGVAHTKLYNEKMCSFYANTSDTKFTAIRHSNCYGPFDKFCLEKGHVFGASMKKVMDAGKKIEMLPEMGAFEVSQRQKESDTITVWGSGEEKRDLLYIDDLCRFVEAAIEKQESKFGLYNCGSGLDVSVNNIVQAIINHSGKQLTVEHDLTAPTIPTSLYLDCSKAKRELGWEPKVGLYEGIQKTLAWYRENVLQG